ncbi:hypothetical protein CB0940_09026 [Cercospora beticola]|uniref:Uncharacterized protein n=1 Tax=Cercospora beticola TaxID=122368 RepID=A0A2G5HGJ5_CERBT|nr:hypothetical protein CB0940_09026 [Cercospora beticola]PIA91615.1 hypothetical protein CB0940_09026 [Cercospora beticola]WPB06699.1 hypothetical protein RHO25_011358 [Cercospora beticola]CAK1366614.1 unnamed protein product [Cercospora beticola]
MDADYLLDDKYDGYDWSRYTWDPATITQYKWDPVTTTQYFNPVITQYDLHPATTATAKSGGTAEHIILSILSSGALGILIVISRVTGYAWSHHVLFGPVQKPQTSQSSADTESNNEDTHDSPPAYSASNEVTAHDTSASAENSSKDESNDPPAYSGNGNATPNERPELSTTENTRASETSPPPPRKRELLALLWLLVGLAAYIGLHIYFAKASFVQERGPQFVGKAALIAFGVVVATDFLLIGVCLTVRCIRGTCFGKRGAVFRR